MLRTNLLLALLLAIKYAQSTEIAATVPTVAVDTAATNLAPAVDLTAGAGAPNLITPLEANLIKPQPKKRRIYYPVDLIGKSKGCIMYDHLLSCGQVNPWTEPTGQMTIQACWRQCLGTKSSYAALYNGNQCLCTNSTITKEAPRGTSDRPCQGNLLQKCGSQTCADFYVLKINSDTLRHSIRNLEEKNKWVHKSSWTSWIRFVDETLDFPLTELFPASSAIYAYRDCVRAPRPACQNFYVVLNGYEDAIIKPNEVIPIDVEWDIVFAKEKNNHADADVLLFRRSLCQWVLKENEIITREFKFVSSNENTRTITLVDTRDSTTIITVNDNTYKELVGSVERTTFNGKWFNRMHHFKNYYRGTEICATPRI